MGRKAMTAEEALAEVGQINEWLQELEEKLQCAMSDPGSEAVPQLHQEIAEATARKEWLFDQIRRMEKAGSYPGSAAPRARRKGSAG
jgi:predicted translin family RNA/ssDNA-binding protein